MTTLENVTERMKVVINTLNEKIKEMYADVYKDSATVAMIKKYGRYIQNRDALKTIEVTVNNYEYIDMQLLPLEKELGLASPRKRGRKPRTSS